MGPLSGGSYLHRGQAQLTKRAQTRTRGVVLLPYQEQVQAGVAALKPKPAIPSNHPSRRADDAERA